MKSFLIKLVKVFHYVTSGLYPPCCRFTPTCSCYAIQALEKHGAVKGMGLAIWRLLRCHPFSKGGDDLVP